MGKKNYFSKFQTKVSPKRQAKLLQTMSKSTFSHIKIASKMSNVAFDSSERQLDTRKLSKAACFCESSSQTDPVIFEKIS